MNELKSLKILITGIAILGIILHLIFPDLKIDSITLGLLIISIIPWLSSLIKSLELPGGYKIEFQEFKKLENEAEKAGLINKGKRKNNTEYEFNKISELSPQIAIVSLRIELEKNLKLVAENNGIEIKKGGIRLIINELYKYNILTNEEMSVLSDMIITLNKAAHGEELDDKITDWVIKIGPQILDSIKNKIK